MLELVNARVVLAKFPGKGGWTYAPTGELRFKPKTRAGLLKVSGRIDEVAVENQTLMSMGQGRRFLAVNAALRQQLGKQAGDTVHLQLFVAEEPGLLTVSLADFTDCLAEEPAALRTFRALPAARQTDWLRWVAQVETDEQKVARMEAALQLLAQEQLLGPPN